MSREQVIEDSYADKGDTYSLGASCTNCGWTGKVRRNKGYEPRFKYDCPRCGCWTVRVSKGDWRGL